MLSVARSVFPAPGATALLGQLLIYEQDGFPSADIESLQADSQRFCDHPMKAVGVRACCVLDCLDSSIRHVRWVFQLVRAPAAASINTHSPPAFDLFVLDARSCACVAVRTSHIEGRLHRRVEEYDNSERETAGFEECQRGAEAHVSPHAPGEGTGGPRGAGTICRAQGVIFSWTFPIRCLFSELSCVDLVVFPPGIFPTCGRVYT